MGRDLALCARRTDRLETLKAQLLKDHPGIRVSVKALDVNNHEQVFEVFRAFAEELGGLDRIIVNAGMGKGQPLGTGFFFKANLQTAQTNFVAAVAQSEAALEILRKQGQGHLVLISSMSAMRGLPGNLTVYAATKAAVASMGEGMHAEFMKKRLPLKVTTIFPGYIRSEINEKVKNTPFMVDTETGCRAMVAAIEREPVKACVPSWPWRLIGWYMRNAPLSWVTKMS